jgi:hypothetical protein
MSIAAALLLPLAAKPAKAEVAAPESVQLAMAAPVAPTAPAPLQCPDGSHLVGSGPPNGLEEGCEGPLPDGSTVRQGPWRTWAANGTLATEGSYRDGQYQGPWTKYHENGVAAARVSFDRGREQGVWTSWNTQGLKVREGSYEAGWRVGLWTSWRDDGSKLEEGRYDKGEKVGVWTTYFPGGALPRADRERAQDPGLLSREEISGLKPRLWKLPPNPKATTDFTAYTLESGEFKIGLLSVAGGVLDNFQLSTTPWLWAIGLPNLNVKIDAIRQGPLDVGLQGGRFWLHQDDFRASYTSVGAIVSLSVLRGWGVHASVTYAGIAAQGNPDICQLSRFITSADCTDASSDQGAGEGSSRGVSGNVVYGEILSVRAATDIRLNRRDSIILQASTIDWARAQVAEGVDVPDIAQLNEVLSFDGPVPLSESYTASAAWQFAWKNAHLRVGWGVSSIPYAFLTQCTELSVRFGGKSRLERTRQKEAWRKNRKAPGADEPRGPIEKPDEDEKQP